MIDQFTIQKLRDLPIEGVAERLGLKVQRHRSLCPFHDDSRPSLMFRPAKNSYRCFVCNEGGSGPIDLTMKVLGKNFIDACRWLADDNNIIVDELKPVKKIPTREVLAPQIDIRHLESLIKHPVLNAEAQKFLFDERKISPEVVAKLGLSSISSPVPMSGNLDGGWFNAPSLLIPYRDVDGKLLSVQARYLGSESGKPRFQFPKGSSCSIYNLPLLKELHEGDELFITEGVSDCLAMLSYNKYAIAIPSATLLKPKDKDILLAFVQSKSLTKHMCPDRDKPGERLYMDLCELLSPSLGGAGGGPIIRHQLPDGYKDFGQWWAQNFHECLH